MQVTVHRIFTLACYTLRGINILTFFLFLQGRKDCSRIQTSFLFFFFKGISGVNSGIIIISGVREEVFFGRTRTTSSLVIFFIIITKAKLLQGWSLICLFLNLNLNVNLNVELNLNLPQQKRRWQMYR